MTVSVLYVCLGNICRSPAAEGMLKHLSKKVEIPLKIQAESCGLGDWHAGQLPDDRMRRATENRGFTLTSRARKFLSSHLEEFDYIFAADSEVLNELYHYAKTPEQKSKIHLMTKFGDVYQGQDVPDPYYESTGAFELVLDILEDSCLGFLHHLSKKQ